MIDIISLLFKDVKSEYSIYYDLYRENIRTRYLYLEALKSTVKVASIKKETIENINVDLKYLYNIDLRFALSNEKMTSDVVTKQNANLVLEKKRYSFNFDVFSLDLTEIIKINTDEKGKEVKEAPKFQVEIELKNRKLPNEEIIGKINNVLKAILGLINS